MSPVPQCHRGHHHFTLSGDCRFCHHRDPAAVRGLRRTRTGIVIGGAYTPPAPDVDVDAALVQRAFLPSPHQE